MPFCRYENCSKDFLQRCEYLDNNRDGRKSRIGHKKCNILLNEKKVTNLEIFQHSSYCVRFMCIKVHIFVKVIYRGTNYANDIDIIQGVRKLYRVKHEKKKKKKTFFPSLIYPGYSKQSHVCIKTNINLVYQDIGLLH